MEGKAAAIDAVNAHLKQWQEAAERIREQFAPILKQQEEFQKSIQPIIEAQKTLQKRLEPILVEQERWKKLVESIEIPKYTLPDISQLVQPVLEFQKSIQGLISPAFEQLQESFQELPPRTQEAVLLLGAHCWYLDLEMALPGLWELKKALSEGKVEEAEEALSEYFAGRLDEIEGSIIERFPNRQKMIRAAFNAHRREEYELSIPVLLAQTDGICKEVVKQYFFIKQNKRPRTAIYVEQIASDTYRAALLSPLAKTLPIGASEHERPEDFTELELDTILCVRTERALRNDFTAAHNKKLYQIEDAIKASKVLVQERIDGSMIMTSKGRSLRFKEITARPVREKKQPVVVVRMRKPLLPPPDHPWRRGFKFGIHKYERGKPIESKI